ncbi:MAG TPA: hypothetical protein VII51_01825 [Gaiellaceae bacterium]
MSKSRTATVVLACLAVAGLAVQAAGASSKHVAAPKAKASSHMLVGINDEADTLYGDPVSAFATLKTLKVQVLRVNLYWGGTKWAVANSKPTDPTDPGDPAYNWALYDRLVEYASLDNIQVVFSILFTPAWANGGKARTVAPTNANDLKNFAAAAAERYSGFWTPPSWQQDASLGIGNEPLPIVNRWTAWNEPNNPDWLTPQYKRIGKKWRVESAFQYAKICNAVYTGVHSVLISPERGFLQGEQVACGVTGPKGNDAPGSIRASVDPLTFLIAAHGFGMKNFDVYAHHPYADAGNEAPNYVPTGRNKRRIQLGNLNVLIAQVTKFYGQKHFWITEYGYQTNPPDKTIFGTSWAKQALYMKQAYAIARKNPRIDMMLWFLVRDEPNIGGWQSGLETVAGKRKPAWNTFIGLPRG